MELGGLNKSVVAVSSNERSVWSRSGFGVPLNNATLFCSVCLANLDQTSTWRNYVTGSVTENKEVTIRWGVRETQTGPAQFTPLRSLALGCTSVQTRELLRHPTKCGSIITKQIYSFRTLLSELASLWAYFFIRTISPSSGMCIYRYYWRIISCITAITCIIRDLTVSGSYHLWV